MESKKLLTSSIFVLALLLVIVPSINFTGVCLPELRWLPDDEIIKNVALQVNGRAYINVRNDDKTDRYQFIPYESLEEFFKTNINCCSVHKSNHRGDGYVPLTFSRKLLGDHGYNVEINFRGRYYDISGEIKESRFQMFYPVSNCGKIVSF